MTKNKNIPWPLDNNTSLINLISEISGEPKNKVTRKLLQEEKCLGWNVREDLLAHQLTPHVWSEGLSNFYSKTNAFLYETSVWNRRPLKQNMREWICEYLTAIFPHPLKILSFGDGLGFDSLYWSKANHHITYFEVSEECFSYAKQVFSNNDVQINMIKSENEIESGSFDMVICLDVLEHVPEPSKILHNFTKWLKKDGFLITHSPFFLVQPYYSTHLKSNQKLSGSCELYTDLGLQPVQSRLFWDPIILKNTQNLSHKQKIPLTTKIGGALLAKGRGRFGLIHSIMARYMSRGESYWVKELASLLEADQD